MVSYVPVADVFPHHERIKQGLPVRSVEIDCGKGSLRRQGMRTVCPFFRYRRLLWSMSVAACLRVQAVRETVSSVADFASAQ
jgi:hypothetical protein